MRAKRHTRTVLLALCAALLLACRRTAAPTPTPLPTTPAPTATLPALVTPTGMASTPTPTTAPATPTAVQSTATAVPPPPTPTAAAVHGLPPLPDAGPLPAIWTAIDLGLGHDLDLRYPSALATDPDTGVIYVMGSCWSYSLHEKDQPGNCLALLDPGTDNVLRVVRTPGSAVYGEIWIGTDEIYLHHGYTGELYALDRETLDLRRARSDAYGFALDELGRALIVDDQGLTREETERAPAPIPRKYERAPVAIAASAQRTYVAGYDALQVFDADLSLVDTIPLPDGQLRDLLLDRDRERLYVGDYDGLYVLDMPQGSALVKTPADLYNARALLLSHDGRRLYATVRLPGWFGGVAIAAVDTETWAVETLYGALQGEIRDLARAGERLLGASAYDHALLPVALEGGEVGPRIPVGGEVIEVLLDPARERLYASDSAGWIHVLDRRTYAPQARLYGGRQISLDAAHGWLYAGDVRQPAVTVYDLDSLSPLRTIAQSGAPRADPTRGEVVIVNRRYYVHDGATGEPRGVIRPQVGVPSEECPGCYYTIASEITIDARRGVTATTTYTPWPGKPGDVHSIAYDPASGRAYHAFQAGGYVHFSSLSVHTDLSGIEARTPPTLRLEGLSGQIALDAAAQRLYLARGSTLYVLDSETLARLGRVEAGSWTPAIAAVDGALGRLYAPHGNRLVVWSASGGARPAPLPHAPMPLTNTVSAIQPSPDYARDRTLLAVIDSRLCRSTDGGESWVRLRGGLPEYGEYVLSTVAVFSPDYAQDRTIFYGAALGEAHGEGVYRSTDGGETWQPASQGLYDLRIYRIVPSSNYAENGTLLAYARTRPAEALYRSTDRGQSWSLVVRQVEYNSPPLPHPAEVVTLGAQPPRFRCDHTGKCERSADDGATWTAVDTGGYATGYLLDQAPSPHYARDGIVYWLTQSALLRYDDRTGVGEICTTPGLYGPRDYTNSFASIAAAARDEARHLLFIGANAGEFHRLAPETLTWERVWPIAAAPTPPSPTPTACAQAVDSRLAPLEAAIAGRLGCASGTATEIGAASQPFEWGRMIWREDLRLIYAIMHADETWHGYPDTWEAGMPDRDPEIVPPEGLLQPVRGFGKLWRETLGGPEAAIGWALAEERGGVLLVQPFARGTLLRDVDGTRFALYDDGTWLAMPDGSGR